jgi:hypothetical protein
MYVGTFNDKKNQLGFLEHAARSLLARVPSAQLYFVGDLDPEQAPTPAGAERQRIGSGGSHPLRRLQRARGRLVLCVRRGLPRQPQRGARPGHDRRPRVGDARRLFRRQLGPRGPRGDVVWSAPSPARRGSRADGGASRAGGRGGSGLFHARAKRRGLSGSVRPARRSELNAESPNRDRP